MSRNKTTAPKKPAAKKNKPPVNSEKKPPDTQPRREKKPFDEKAAYYQVMPYMLSFLGAFLLICFAFPEKMKQLGTLTTVLSGIFSYGAWGIPFFIMIAAMFWKQDAARHRGKTRAVYSLICLVFLSIAAQLVTRTGDIPFQDADGVRYQIGTLYQSGKTLESGGVVGGVIGEWLYSLAGWGAGIITGAALVIFGFALFNITPIDAFVYIRNRISESLYDRREMRKRVKPEQHESQNETDIDDPRDARHIRDPKFKTDDKKVIIQGREDFFADIPLGQEEDAGTVAGFDAKEQVKAVAAQGSPNGEGHDGARDMETGTPRAEQNISGGGISLKDIFTEDAVIAAAGMEVQKNVLLEADQDADSELSGAKARAGARIGDDAGEEDFLEVSSGEIKVSSKPTRKETYRFPSISLLEQDPNPATFSITAELKSTSLKLVETLSNFGVRTKIMNISCGPTVTRYELQPEIGVRVRSIQNLSDDIALHLAASGVRIEAPIPGKDAVGIEVPNKTVSIVYLRNLIESQTFAELKSRLSVCLGMDVAGSPIYMDMAKMPHLLIAGATGMGKSVCINSFIVSLLYKARPDEVKLILIDPKKVELSIYNGIPHLLVPVVTDPKKAAGALSWAVNEMERRFALIEEVGVRDIKTYNEVTRKDPEKEFMPQVVIIIDELADLMMTARDEVETSICRLAQKARAAGMHLLIGTQRPSVDVITGLIKANIPSRIAFTVASQVDSRTIIDIAGAEKLLGRGDMLFAPVGCMKPMRVQGAYVSANEVEAIADILKKQINAEYDADIIDSIEREAARCGEKKRGRLSSGEDETFGNELDSDDMILPAIGVAMEGGQLSTSLLQRRLSLGYARAARIVDTLEMMGIVGPYEGSRPRKVLITKEEYLELKMKNAGNISR